MTLDQWLSKIYQKGIRNDAERTSAIAEFKIALAGDTNLKSQATTRLAELEHLVSVRGEAACTYSNWYRLFLKEALA